MTTDNIDWPTIAEVIRSAYALWNARLIALKSEVMDGLDSGDSESLRACQQRISGTGQEVWDAALRSDFAQIGDCEGADIRTAAKQCQLFLFMMCTEAQLEDMLPSADEANDFLMEATPDQLLWLLQVNPGIVVRLARLARPIEGETPEAVIRKAQRLTELLNRRSAAWPAQPRTSAWRPTWMNGTG